jgi:hypothetical protein
LRIPSSNLRRVSPGSVRIGNAGTETSLSKHGAITSILRRTNGARWCYLQYVGVEQPPIKSFVAKLRTHDKKQTPILSPIYTHIPVSAQFVILEQQQLVSEYGNRNPKTARKERVTLRDERFETEVSL